jgi:hypothetical protein
MATPLGIPIIYGIDAVHGLDITDPLLENITPGC